MRRALLRLLLWSVAGGLPPRRPDQFVPTSPAGVAPGASSGITRARLVIISGPSSGMFLYSGTPGSGDLVESVTEATSDPFHNIAHPGFTSYDNVFGGVAQLHGAILKLFSGATLGAQLSPSGLVVFNSHGALLYDIDVGHAAEFGYADTGSATQGALITSSAQLGGTDQFGNAYVAGVANYVAVAGHGVFAVSLISAGPLFYSASTAAGPYTQVAGVTVGSGALVGIPSGALVLGSQNSFVLAIPADGTVYTCGENDMTNSAAQTITPTAVTPITGLAQAVASGDTYYFRGVFRLKQGTVANVNQNVGFSGPATSACVWYYSVGGQGASTTSQKIVVGSLSTVAIGFAAVSDEQYVAFEGTVTFSAAGTFEAVAQAPTAGDNFIVQPGCIFSVRPVG